MIDFTNKVVIITGASSGIGAETAKLFAEYNARLTIIGRNTDRLSAVAKECQAKNGLTPLCLILELTKTGSCECIVQRTVEAYGRIDVLVNCAGNVKVASLFDQSMEVFDELLNINLRVPYLLSQLALPHLVKTKGNIINIGASLFSRCKPGFLPYSVSKVALEKFSKEAAPELAGEGVRINAICPGVTRTNVLENFNIDDAFKPVVFESIAETLPQRKIIEPREVAMLICITASGMFPNMTGSAFVLDGAASMT